MYSFLNAYWPRGDGDDECVKRSAAGHERAVVPISVNLRGKKKGNNKRKERKKSRKKKKRIDIKSKRHGVKEKKKTRYSSLDRTVQIAARRRPPAQRRV